MTDIDFTTYVENKKIFYEKLSEFSILPENISCGVKLDKLFFERINNEFAYFFERRKSNIRITKSESLAYKSQFNSLDEKIIEIYNYKGPAIYWFKIKLEGNSSNDKIINRFSSIRNQKSGWWSKAKKVVGKQTEYLYVGKVEKNLYDRFTQHMGLGHKMTSSLKLAQWFATLENVELSYHFLKVDNEYFDYLEDIENVIWRKLNPLLGAEPRIK